MEIVELSNCWIVELLNCRTVELSNWDLESSFRDKKLRIGWTMNNLSAAAEPPMELVELGVPGSEFNSPPALFYVGIPR